MFTSLFRKAPSLSRASAFRLRMNSSKFHTTSDDKAEFRDLLAKAKNVVFLTGAGVSAESGIPTFRGAGGLWRTYAAQDLATPSAFRQNPSLVWEFYSYRREVVLSKEPNKAHVAIGEFQGRMRSEGKNVSVVTQNIDGLHQQAGAKDVIELHVNLGQVHQGLAPPSKVSTGNFVFLPNRSAPDPTTPEAGIPELELPRCSQPGCVSMVRPAVVWFGESLDHGVLAKTDEVLAQCDVCLLVGTSSVVYPAAGYAPMLAARGVPVAEFNLEETPATGAFRYHFQGPAGETLPPILAPF